MSKPQTPPKPADKNPEKPREHEKNLDRDGGERQPNQQTDKK